MASTVLVVGATRGLGAALAKAYAAQPATTVFATTRAQTAPSAPAGPNIHWIPSVDISSPTAGPTLASHLRNHGKQVQLDVTIITAGYFGTETFDAPDWDKEVKMYVTSAIGPVFVVQALVKAGLVREAAGVGGKGGDGGAGAGRVVLVTSESGSVALRHESEGGGNYGHHASKAAGNMVGRLLSLDLRDRGIAVVSVHPGFMRTEMTKSVGFDKFYDDGGAVTPDEAAPSLIGFVDTVDMSKTGQLWAPRGARDIGTAGTVLGKGLPTPLQLPW